MAHVRENLGENSRFINGVGGCVVRNYDAARGKFMCGFMWHGCGQNKISTSGGET